MKKNTNRRVQKPKGNGNDPMMRAMQGKRSSNAAGFHPPKSDYRRKPKYGNSWGEEA